MASKIPFQYANSTSTPPTPTTTSFTLNTTSSTDIWRKPPTKNVFTAPILYKTLPLSTFLRARVSVTAEWATLYDQGGLVFILPQPDGSKKWIKSGIEFYKGAAYVSTVAADNWADWSLVKADGDAVTLEFERLGDAGGDVATLWVYVVDKDGKGKIPVREVTWALNDPEGNAEVWVGVYVAKPTASAEGVAENLEVSFTGFELDVSS